LLDLASFLGPVCFGLFGDFIPKGENVRPKQACGVSLQVGSRMLTSDFKDLRPKGENVNIRAKRGKFDLGGVWMMVSIQASVSGSNSVNSSKFMLALVVLS
jgi:hypothetical protein